MVGHTCKIFQNLTSFRVGYFTINPYLGEGIFDLGYLEAQKAVYEDDYIRHIRFKSPVRIIIDGRASKGVVYKEGLGFDPGEDKCS